MKFEDFFEENNSKNKCEDNHIVGFLSKECYNKTCKEDCKDCVCSVLDDVTLRDLHNQVIYLLLDPDSPKELNFDKEVIKTAVWNTIALTKDIKEDFKSAKELAIQCKYDEIVELTKKFMGDNVDSSIVDILFDSEE